MLNSETTTQKVFTNHLIFIAKFFSFSMSSSLIKNLMDHSIPAF